jgi:hypothetical protein
MDDQEYDARTASFSETMDLITTIEHPNLARIIDYFVENRRAYVVIKYIDGITVEHFVGVIEKLDETQVVRIGITLADAVQFLWNRPRPLSFETIDIEHVMVDVNKNLTFMGYDFTKFFYDEFPFSSFADSPEVVERSVYKISRIMLFLLGGGKEVTEERVPSEMSVSDPMRKLLMVTLNEKQKSYSSLGKFKEELEKIGDPQRTARQEQEYIRRIKRIREEIPTLDWIKKVPGKIFRAVAGQKVWLMVLEVLFIVFLVGFSFINMHTEQVKFVKPPETSVVYVACQDELLTIREDDYQIIDKRSFGTNINSLCFIKNDKGQFLAAADSQAGKLLIINPSDNTKTAEISIDGDSSKMFGNKDNSLLVVFSGKNNSITLINTKTLEVTGVMSTGTDSVDIAFCPGKNTLVITNGVTQDILWLNPDKRSSSTSMKLPVQPGLIAVSPDGAFICVQDRQEDSLKMLDTKVDTPVLENLPEVGGKKIRNMLWDTLYYRVWLIFSDADNMVLYNLSEKKALKNMKLGNNPIKAVWGRDRKKLWVINEGSRELMVMDPESGKCEHKTILDKTPGDLETSRD